MLTVSPAAPLNLYVLLCATAGTLPGRVCPHVMGAAQVEAVSETTTRFTSYEPVRCSLPSCTRIV